MAHRVFQTWDGSNGEIGQDILASAPCAISGTHDAKVVFHRDRYGFPMRTVISRATGLVYTDPRPTEESIDDFYRSTYRRFYKSSVQPKWKHTARNARIAAQRMETIQSYATKGAAILDIGTGSGELLHVGNRLGFEMQGIEVDQTYAQFGRQSYGVKIINQSLNRAPLASQSFDVATLYHVLEHFADPAGALRKVANALKPEGIILIEVPNVESIDTGFRQKWHAGHLFHFNCHTLPALANACGLEVVSVNTCAGRNVVWATLRKPRQPISLNWQETTVGNFERTWQLLREQADRRLLGEIPARVRRAGRKLKRNLHEWTATVSATNRRNLVDKLTQKRVA